MSDSGAHHPTAIVTGKFVGQNLAPWQSQSRAAKCAWKRSVTWLAGFSSRGVCGCSSSNLASAASRSASLKISQRLSRSPSTIRMMISPDSTSRPSCEVACVAWATTAPRLVNRCTVCDVDSGFRRDVPKGTDVRGQRIWLDCAEVAMVDIRPVRRRRRERAAVQRGVGLRDDRPRVRVGGCFAGKVTGVEFLEGGVDSRRVEHDGRCDSVVVVDLEDVEQLRNGTPRALGRGPRSGSERARGALRGSRSMVGLTSVTPMSAARCSSRSRHLDHVGFPRSRPDGDLRVKISSASISAIASQSRAAKSR